MERSRPPKPRRLVLLGALALAGAASAPAQTAPSEERPGLPAEAVAPRIDGGEASRPLRARLDTAPSRLGARHRPTGSPDEIRFPTELTGTRRSYPLAAVQQRHVRNGVATRPPAGWPGTGEWRSQRVEYRYGSFFRDGLLVDAPIAVTVRWAPEGARCDAAALAAAPLHVLARHADGIAAQVVVEAPEADGEDLLAQLPAAGVRAMLAPLLDQVSPWAGACR